MDKCYIDYEYYMNSFNGNIIPNESFKKYAKKASSKINYYTSNNIEEVTDDIKDATCEIAEVLFNQEKLKNKVINENSSQKSSETVGPWTVHYTDNSQYQSNQIMSDKELNTTIYQICKEYLIDSGLLFRGVNYVSS